MRLSLAHYIAYLLLTQLFWLVPGAAREPTEFVALYSSVSKDVSEVHLPPRCPKNALVTRTMFTFEPSSGDKEEVQIFTYPVDLVNVQKEKSGQLQLDWNPDVAYKVKEGGVLIRLPANQLQTVVAAASSKAQILDGFTNINRIKVSSDAQLHATFTNSTSTELSVSVSSDAYAYIKSNIPLVELSVSSDGKLDIEAPFVDEVKISSDAKVSLKGNAIGMVKVSSDGRLKVDGTIKDAKISSDAKVTVSGNVTGSVDLSSDAKLNVGNYITGYVSASSDAKVYARSCDNVSKTSDAKCLEGDSVNGTVIVNVPVLPYTLIGLSRCGPLFTWWGAIGTGIAVVIIIVILCVICCSSCARGMIFRTQETTSPPYPVQQQPDTIAEVIGYEDNNRTQKPQNQQQTATASFVVSYDDNMV